jgi:release factor glutamine methyltransferase
MSQSISIALLEATRLLNAANIPEARREAGSLLANLLGQDRAFLITHSETVLTDTQVTEFLARVKRRSIGEPLQYITGAQEFFGLMFEVNSDVLIPRPETELLVESALEVIDGSGGSRLLLDVGTGTGCITIALLHERPGLSAVAVDASAAAIRLATRNAERHTVEERISFLVSDAWSALAVEPVFDLIVSNPPYIPNSEWETLQREVRDHEPRLALTSGDDGLTMIRRLVPDSAAFLHRGGYLIFEIGYNQSDAVKGLIDQGVWELVAIRRDLQNIPRIVVLRKK